MDVGDSSVDGIIFSPPYSFAIDYVTNDEFHLNALGVNCNALRETMVGIRGGRKLIDKYTVYVEDMEQIIKECYRVLRPDMLCVIIIGTNTNQLSKVLKIPKEEVEGLQELIRRLGQDAGFSFVNQIQRVISGISNTMREEFIIFLRKE